MPYLISTFSGETAKYQAQARRPFGPGLDRGLAQRVEKLEVWGSTFKDPGGDYCEYKAYDANNTLLANERVQGY